MMVELKKISKYIYEVPKSGDMKVPGRIFISEELLEGVDDKCIQQVQNVAKLPGILKYSYAMPDIHMGYGFPIGGVAAFDVEKGIVSPGGVGYDINCGVRLLATDISLKDFMENREKILHDIKRTIPSGVGRGTKSKHTREEILEVLKNGSEWALSKGFALKEDLERTEEGGRMEGANPVDVSQRAVSRGLGQLGTLGAGNHFIDILNVEETFEPAIAEKFHLKKDNVVFMIHCGSRGLGHQVASDYIKLMEKEFGVSKFPDRELVNAPINSELGKKYLSAMNCAVNFAFCNRQMIMHHVRELLKRYYPKNKFEMVYDVCHNIAKFEEFNGGSTNKSQASSSKGRERKQVCIHRKGATRCFGPGRKEVPAIYREVGQPVFIPGSMGTSSYVLVGTKEAEELAFGSTAHGAGRVMSRTAARKSRTKEDVEKMLKEKDIYLEAGGVKGIIEEAPESYKDIEAVIDVCRGTGLGKPVAKLRPIAIMIG